MTDLLMKELNQYTPHNYAVMTDGEKRAARDGFHAGYNYRDSLTPAQAVTDEMVERGYAALLAMRKTDENWTLDLRAVLVAALSNG